MKTFDPGSPQVLMEHVLITAIDGTLIDHPSLILMTKMIPESTNLVQLFTKC
jgi:hypothetical protein